MTHCRTTFTSPCALLRVLTAIVLAATLTAAAFAQHDTPTATVRSMTSDVLSIVSSEDYSGLENHYDEIDAIVTRAFDPNTLAQSALGSTWRDISQAQRDEFETLFFETLKRTYIERLESSYDGQEVEYLSEDTEGPRGIVRTRIISGNSEIPVNYLLRRRPEGWLIYDVEVEGVSLISSYRSTYRSIIRRDGMESLLQQIRERVNTP